jgi:hypothetical protein
MIPLTSHDFLMSAEPLHAGWIIWRRRKHGRRYREDGIGWVCPQKYNNLVIYPVTTVRMGLEAKILLAFCEDNRMGLLDGMAKINWPLAEASAEGGISLAVHLR